LYQEVGSLIPDLGEKPKFAQIYFYDSTNYVNQVNRRHEIMNKSLNYEMLTELQKELIEINPFVHTFMSAGIIEESQDHEILYIKIYNTHGKDMRLYNAPIAEEIAAICLEDDEIIQERDILIKRCDNKLERISELNGAYDPLQYPLLFPFGEYGWHDGILRANVQGIGAIEHEESQTGASQFFEELALESFSSISELEEEPKGKEKVMEIESDDNSSQSDDENLRSSKIQQKDKIKRVSIREFVVYRFMIRDSNKSKSILHLAGRLFQQYIVDQYVKWETNNLN